MAQSKRAAFNPTKHERPTSVQGVSKIFPKAWDISSQFLKMHPTCGVIGIINAGNDVHHNV
jgi:hypothetical protein